MAVFTTQSPFAEAVKHKVWINPFYVQSITESEKGVKTYIKLGENSGFWVENTFEEALAKLGVDIK